jgi:hypothetical protein
VLPAARARGPYARASAIEWRSLRFVEHAMRLNLLLMGVALAAAPALAQQPAADAGESEAVPKHNCAKPGEFPGSLASDNQKRQYQREYVAYTDCLKKFVMDQNKLAQPHIKAANSTVEEYNAAVKFYNDLVDKNK